MEILITICARGGSKGIPGKNIKLLNGKPLIYYTLKIAEAFAKTRRSHIVLSTDSQEIKDVVSRFNLPVDLDYRRPERLAGDSIGKLDAIHDALNYAQEKKNVIYDYVIDLDVTSPLRSVQDIEKAFDKLFKHPAAYNIFSVSRANRNPYFNMVEENEDGYVDLCKEGQFFSRQSAPTVYDMNASFYIYKSSFFERGFKGAITDRSLAYCQNHICFDLDHQVDFEFMEYLLANNKLDFEYL